MGKYWRTNAWYKVVRALVGKIFTRKFNYRAPKIDMKGPFIVLSNHTTDYDAFFLAMTFKEPLHFVMSDHVSSIPVAGKLIKHLVDVIPITKSTIDPATTKKIFTVAKNGGAIGIFPEGNKSFSGRMSEMKPSIAKLLKRLKIPVVLYAIEGGYLSSPRWTKVKRKGYMYGKVRYIIQPEELATLTEEEIFDKVVKNLHVSAYDVQASRNIEYVGEDLAKHVESLLYMCPSCHSLCSVYGEHNHIKCRNCDLLGEFDNYGYVHGTPYSRLDEWDAWQKSELKKMDFSKFEDTPIMQDSGFTIKQKINNYKNQDLGTYHIALFNNRLEFSPEKSKKKIEFKPFTVPLDQIAGLAVEGVNGIQLWTKTNEVYRITNEYTVSGLKYVNCIWAITGQPMKF